MHSVACTLRVLALLAYYPHSVGVGIGPPLLLSIAMHSCSTLRQCACLSLSILPPSHETMLRGFTQPTLQHVVGLSKDGDMIYPSLTPYQVSPKIDPLQ